MALKGTTVIELTNVKTGEKEEYRDENMITNALNRFLTPIGYLKGFGSLRSCDPIVTNFMGGMILFDSTLDESADNIFPPASALPVGYACDDYVNATTDIAIGSSNLTEREYNTYSGYMKFVYDFTTAQANGTIRSVALTNSYIGRYAGLGSHTYVQSSGSFLSLCEHFGDQILPFSYSARYHYEGVAVGEYEHPFLVDVENDIVYSFSVISATKIRITRRIGNFRSVNVVLSHRRTKALIDENDITLTASISTSYMAWNYDHDDGCLYLFGSSASSKASGTAISVVKVSIPDLAVTQYSVTNSTGTTILTNGSRFAFGHQGYVFVHKNDDPSVVYKIEISASANCTTIIGSLTSSGCRAVIAHKGYVYYEFPDSGGDYIRSYLGVVNSAANKVMNPGLSHIYDRRYPRYTRDIIPVKNDPMHWIAVHYTNQYEGRQSEYQGYFLATRNYLATINNLSRAIEKTSDKTMKITYTIQEM